MRNLRTRFVFIITIIMMTFAVCFSSLYFYAVHVVRFNAQENYQELMNLTVNQLNDSITAMTYFLVSLQQSPDFVEARATNEDYRFYTDASILKTSLTSSVQSYLYIDELFIYFPERTYLIEGVKNQSNLAGSSVATDMLKGIFENMSEDDFSQQWNVIQDENGCSYLVRIYSMGGVYVGGLLCVNTITDILSLSSASGNDLFLITDLNGSILSDNNMKDEVHKNFFQDLSSSQYVTIGAEEYFCTMHRMGEEEFYIAALIPEAEITGGLSALRYAVMLLIPLSALIFIASILIGRRWIVKPAIDISHSMDVFNQNPEVRIHLKKAPMEFSIIETSFNAMADNIENLKIVAYEEKIKQQNAMLQYMKLQANPHFYINCLNVINSYAVMGECSKISRMVQYLGNHIRYALDNSTQISLSKELDAVSNYMEIQLLRYGDCVDAETEVEPGTEDFPVPPMIILTFVENAIKHEAAPGRQTTVYIVITKASGKDPSIHIEIWDNGDGFSEEALRKIRNHEKIIYDGREHMGISNIVSRIHLIYGDRASITFRNHPETGGAYIEITLPYQTADCKYMKQQLP